MRFGRKTAVAAAPLLLVTVALAPSAQAVATANLSADFGCSPTTLGRDIEAPANGKPFGSLQVSGTVTGLTPGQYYYLQVPGAGSGDTASGTAVVGTADPRGSVTMRNEGLYLPPSFVMPGPVPFEIHRSGGGNGVVVATGQFPVAARGDARCTSLYRLVSGPLSTVVTYGFNLQPDGNVVERTVNYGKTLWTTGTVGHPGASAVLQTDGNFVVRDTSGRAVWNSGTMGHPNSTLTVQSDSNVVIRDAFGRAVWSTGIHR